MKQKPINYRYTVYYIISQISTLIVIGYIDLFRRSRFIILAVVILNMIATYLFLYSIFRMADYSSVNESVTKEREKAAVHLQKYKEIAMRQSFLSEMIHDIIHRHFVTAQLSKEKAEEYLEQCRQDYRNSFDTEYTGISSVNLALNFYCFHASARTGRIPEITFTSGTFNPDAILEKTEQLDKAGTYPSLTITEDEVVIC